MVHAFPSIRGVVMQGGASNNNMGNGRVKEERTIVERIWMFVGVLNQIITIIIAVYTSYLALNGKVGLYELHIALPTIGYQLLMTQTILTFAGENIWSHFLSRDLKKSIHWALGASGSTLAVGGTSLMIYAKSSHFTSTHGILGFVAMLCVLVTFINGPITYFASKINFVRPVFIKINHYVMATSGFVIGMASLILGFEKNWFKSRTSPEIATAVIVLSSLTIIFTMRSALVHMFHVVKGLFRN